GPGQEFKPPCSKLAEEWPDDGPKKIWSRDLGDGYSAILADGGQLFTMLRDAASPAESPVRAGSAPGGDKEAVICLDAASGKTVWETKYDAQPAPGHVVQFGTGPRSTPLLDGDRIYTIGISGVMHCLSKKTGE